MSKTKTATRAKKSPRPQGATGTYRYDRKTGEVVRVSAGVPKVASKGKSSSADVGPCGRPCGGRCPA